MKSLIKINKKVITIMFLAVCLIIGQLCIAPSTATAQLLHTLKYKKPQDYFSYTGDSSILISGHRGEQVKFYPENSIEAFEDVLLHMPAFFEIDPRLTKDSVIVLMHDATLDRTTTGTGKLSNYTWAELQSIRLKDKNGDVTQYKIPKLEDVIKWSKNKTVINLDKKDVPMEMIAVLIKDLHAEHHVMLTVHNGEQAKFYYNHFKHIMLSAFMRTMEEYNDFKATNIPWENFIAYVGPIIGEENREVVSSLHKNKVRCMIAFGPNHDKLTTFKERHDAYLQEINRKPDIIESNFPKEVWKAMQIQ